MLTTATTPATTPAATTSPTGAGRARRLRLDRGSVLILMPAAVLIVLLLGAVAVDLTIVHLRQQQAVEAAASAANDAVTVGVDQAALRAGHGYTLDPDQVRAAVDQSLDDQGLADQLAAPPQIRQTAASVTVTVTLRADYVFARSLPDTPHSTTVTGTATAQARLAPN